MFLIQCGRLNADISPRAISLQNNNHVRIIISSWALMYTSCDLMMIICKSAHMHEKVRNKQSPNMANSSTQFHQHTHSYSVGYNGTLLAS